jgi:hypothetical protein
MRAGRVARKQANLTMKRRLIGPTIISLVMCGLLLDHIFFNKSPWSVVNVLSKLLSIFGAIVSPFNPAEYAWLDAVAMPIMIAALAVVLLVLIVARAKSAMSKATPNADISVAWPAPRVRTLPIPSDAQIRSPWTVPSKPRACGLMTKLTLSFASVGVLFSLCACIIV